MHIFLSFPRIFITLFTLLTLFRFFIVSIREPNTQTYSFIHFRKKIFLVSIHYLWTALCKWKHLLFSCFIYWCLFSYFILTFTYITFSIFFFPPFLSCQPCSHNDVVGLMQPRRDCCLDPDSKIFVSQRGNCLDEAKSQHNTTSFLSQCIYKEFVA